MKIQFFYASGHSFTANNVTSYGEADDDSSIIVYETESARGDIYTIAQHQVPTFDLLFAVVSPQHGELPAEGDIHTTTIIHGRATKFDIGVAAAQMAQIIGEAQDEANADEAHLNWKAKEFAKYRERQKRRHQEAAAAEAANDERSIEQRVADQFNEEVGDMLPLIKKVINAVNK